MDSRRRFVGLTWRAALIASLVPGIVLAIPTMGWLFFVPYAVVGAILVSRRPRNVVGWILLVGAWSFVFIFLEINASPARLIAGTAGWQNETLAWLSSWSAQAGLALFFILTILFPEGRMPAGRRGRAAGVAIGAVAALVALATILPVMTVTPKGATNGVNVSNPFALLHGGIWNQVQPGMLLGLGLAALVAGVLFMLIRFARAQGLERQQLRWLVTSLALITATVVTGLVLVSIRPDAGGVAWIPATIAFPLLPVAVGVAVLRYRLYQLDVIINRSIAYLLLTGLLAGLYAGAVALFQRIFVGLTGDRSDAAIILSTLLLASVFTPVRKWLEALLDRRLQPTPHPADIAGPPATTGGSAPATRPEQAEWEARVELIARRVFDEQRASQLAIDDGDHHPPKS